MSLRDDEHLIQAAFDRAVTETDFEQLEARLHDEPELRRLYRDYAGLHHALCEEFEGRAHLEERLRTLRDAKPKRATVVQSFLSAAAIIMALAAVAYFIVVRPHSATAHVSYGPESNAAIVHSDGKSRAGQLRKGSRLILKRGTVEVALPSGARALVEGPATVVGGGRNALGLRAGRAWFHVPPGAKGFVCNTPALEVTDLGTEFGVIAAPGDEEEVHVLTGRVRVHPHGRPGEFRELEAGEGLAWSGEYFTHPVSGDEFVTTLPKNYVTLSENFGGRDEIRLHGKRADAGDAAWIVTEGNPMVLDGVLDSAGSPSSAFVPLDTSRLDEVNRILLVTVDAAEPDTRAFHSPGWAGISLFTGSEERLFIGDPFGPGTCWSLHPFGGEVAASDPPLHGRQVVTVRYDYRTGLTELFAGHDSRGRALASVTLSPGLRFDQLRVANGEGGDIALRLIRASVLVSDPMR